MRAPSPSRLKRYFSVIIRWCAITFVVFAITLYTGKYVTENFIPKVYTATTEIEISHPWDNDTDRDMDGAALHQHEIETMQSPDLLRVVISDLQLDKAWAIQGNKLPMQAALDHLTKTLRIEFKGSTNIVEITATSNNPKEAAAISNAVANHYKTMSDIDVDKRNSREMNNLREQIAEQQKVVDAQSASVEKLRQNLAGKPVTTPATSPNQVKTLVEAEHVAGAQQSLLNALNYRLQEDFDGHSHLQSSVRIISRAEVPEYPSSPDKLLCFGITVLIAVLVSLVIGCFVEMILLFIRASEGEHS